jgi:peptidoglycan hydrolase-like amidase
MSQYGAQGRALRGESFENILRAYYAGIDLALAFSGDALGRALGSLATRTGPNRD